MDFMLHYHHHHQYHHNNNNININNNNNNNNVHTQVVTFHIAANDHTINCLDMKKIDMNAATTSSSLSSSAAAASTTSSSLTAAAATVSVGGCAALIITGTLMKVTPLDVENQQLMNHNEELFQFKQYINDNDKSPINHHDQDHHDDDHNDDEHRFYKLQITTMKLIPYLEGQSSSSAIPIDIDTYYAVTYSELELMDYDDFEYK